VIDGSFFIMLVQKLRLKRGWSQQQLADLSGLSVRTIQRIENGQPASMETLKSLASVFEIDMSELTSEPEMSTTTASSPSPHVSSNPSMSAEVASSEKGMSSEEILALQHVRKVKGFYIGLIQYAVVMAVLLVINMVTTPHRWWVIWPALGWGIAMVMRAVRTFELVPFLNGDWEKKQVEKRLGRPL
jgi:DNA-binding XRE family transcriptional regulator